jgi:transposase InsO family protein
LALVDLSVVEQRYRAVLEVQAGMTVTEVAARFGVSRQSVHAWVRRYRQEGLGGLTDRSKQPRSCPHQLPADVQVLVCELRREHPRWGPVRLVFELDKAGVQPVASRMSVYRTLVRHGLVMRGARRRRREDFVRWEREEPMALWQIDIVEGVMLVDARTGELREAKVVTGVDDHSRYCVIASVVERATGRAVCLAFAAALRAYGAPGEVLSDNGKQFTDRFGRGGEVLFDRICRENAIVHRLTLPRSPTTTGKIERFHQTLRRELLDDADAFADLEAAQAAVDGWVHEYNTSRPHQALGMASPAARFDTRRARDEQELLGLRLPAALRPAAAPEPVVAARAGSEPSAVKPSGEDAAEAQGVVARAWMSGPVELERVVPASGNMWLAGRQLWLGPQQAGTTVTIWADTDVIHVLAGGVRLKTLRSHFSTADLAALAARGARQAGPPPLPPAQPGAAVEVKRTVNAAGCVSLAGRQLLAAEILAGRRVAVRIKPATLMFYDPNSRELLRTRPNTLTQDQTRRLQGARAAGPPPRPRTAPITVQRRVSATGMITVCAQKIALGRPSAGHIVSIDVSEHTLTIRLDDDTRTIRRTTTNPVRHVKANRPRKATHVL